MKKSVYLDTTIPSYLFDERPEIQFQAQITKRWWDVESKKYVVTTSPTTIAELSRGEYPAKHKILDFAPRLALLPFADEIREVAETYVRNYLMPRDFAGDALHLAYASFHKVDFLPTWNCNHLANASKRTHVRILNTRLGLFVPEITTPLELFEEDADVHG